MRGNRRQWRKKTVDMSACMQYSYLYHNTKGMGVYTSSALVELGDNAHSNGQTLISEHKSSQVVKLLEGLNTQRYR